jgi:hypothetical protein
MCGLRFDRLMSSTALALPLLVVLTGPPSLANSPAIESAVPMPQAAPLAPPTASDAGVATEGLGTQTEPAPVTTAG